MARWRKVDVRIWNDQKFRALSEDGRMLWLYLVTCPETTAIPGVVMTGRGAICDALGWLPERFAQPFQELSAKGMAEADFEARLVWLPKAIKYNPPANGNVVKGWADQWDEVPECPLKAEVWRTLKQYTERFQEQFTQACPQPFPDESPNRIANQEQEQEQEQESVSSSEDEQARPGPAPASGPEIPEEAWSLADRLVERIEARQPDYRELLPKRREATRRRWADAFRLAHQQDERSWSEMREVLDWCQQDSFWAPNILSGAKFREKYDQLKGQRATKRPPGSHGHYKHTGDEEFAGGEVDL